MRKFLYASCVLCLTSTSAVFAQNANQPMSSNALSFGGIFAPSNLNFILKLQDRFSLLDTTRGSAFDSFSQTARFGMDYNFKRLSASFIMQYDGGSADTGGSTRIRKAFVQYTVLKAENNSIAVGMGREHLSGSVIYAPDALNSLYASNLDNFNTGEDGVDVLSKNKFNFGEISLLAGVFNNLGARTFASNGYLSYTSPLTMASTNSGTNFNKPAVNGNRAYVFQGRGNVPFKEGNIQVNALYGTQDNAPMDTASTSGTSVRDVNYFEGSLGYALKNKSLQAGLWYQNINMGKLFVRNNSAQQSGANYSYVNLAGSTSTEQSTYGVGFVGTSALFGMSNFTGDNVGDVFTFGAGFQRQTNTLATTSYGVATSATTGATSDPISSLPASRIDLYNASVGYKYASASFELNAVQAYSTASSFYTKNDIPDSATTKGNSKATLVYLTGIIAL